MPGASAFAQAPRFETTRIADGVYQPGSYAEWFPLNVRALYRWVARPLGGLQDWPG